VAHVFDIGQLEGGTAFMVSELLAGSDLGRWLPSAGPLPLEQALALMIAIADAVAEAHDHRIVHRDLKPDNLFVSREATGALCVKLLDFGVAKELDAEANLTEPDRCVGSPYYMSPEQIIASRAVDARSDIWALGVILFEILTGEMPFRGDTIPEVCGAILRAECPRPKGPVALPAAVEQIIFKCLQKRPDARFASVRELKGALTDAAGLRAESSTPRAGTPKPARPMPTRAPAPSAPRRGNRLRGAWIAAGVSAVSLAAGVAWLTTSPSASQAGVLGPSARTSLDAQAAVFGASELRCEAMTPTGETQSALQTAELPGVACPEPAIPTANAPPPSVWTRALRATSPVTGVAERSLPRRSDTTRRDARPDHKSATSYVGPWQERAVQYGEHFDTRELVDPYAELR
jgi:serine/threonine-protein kinase